jgi:hypothetical protein
LIGEKLTNDEINEMINLYGKEGKLDETGNQNKKKK